MPFQASGSSIFRRCLRARRWRDRAAPFGLEVRQAGGGPLRTKCFIETVSPARSSVRSNTVRARSSARARWPPDARNARARCPCQLLNTKAMSSLACAVTKKPASAGIAFSTSACATIATPLVRSCQPTGAGCGSRSRPPRRRPPVRHGPARSPTPARSRGRSSRARRDWWRAPPCARTSVPSCRAAPRRGGAIRSRPHGSPAARAECRPPRRPRVAAGELRQLEALRLRVGGEQRDLARGDVFLDAALEHTPLGITLFHRLEPLALRPAQRLRAQPRLVVFEHLAYQPAPRHRYRAGANARRRPHSHRAVCGRSSPCTGAASPAARRRRPRARRCRRAAAANLAIGGASPVATVSGKLAALASGRPALSFRPRAAPRQRAFSASGVGKAMDWRLLALVVLVEFRRDHRAAAGRLQPHLLGERKRAMAPRSRTASGGSAGRARRRASRSQEKLCREGRAHGSRNAARRCQHLGLAARRCRGPTPCAHARRTGKRALAARQQRRIRRLLRNAARLQHRPRASAPPTITSGRRSPMPLGLRTRRWPASLAGVTAPTGAAGSAVLLDGGAVPGLVAITAGPPVEKANRLHR